MMAVQGVGNPHETPALAFHDVTISFQTKAISSPVVRNATLTIAPGEAMALVGESGSGKSTLAYAAMGDELNGARVISGRVEVSGTDISTLSGPMLQRLRGGKVAMVPQDPMTSLSPSLRIGRQLYEVLSLHHGLKGRPLEDSASEALRLVDLTDVPRILRSYPHQLSGGQQQRVLLSLAMAGQPGLLILDEATTGLDVTTEARILELVGRIQRETRTSVLLITHNLGIVRRFCQSVAVIYFGDIVEIGSVEAVLNHPAHPYSRALLDCIPPIDSHITGQMLPTIEGAIPRRTDMPAGCLFAPRCQRATDVCSERVPELRTISPGYLARCVYAEDELASMLRSPRDTLLNERDSSSVHRPIPLLEVKDLVVTYQSGRHRVTAVNKISFSCNRGEVLGIVGESGCGKTSLARCIVGLIEPKGGQIVFDGQELTGYGLRRPHPLRKSVQMVFQNPQSSINPQHTVEQCLMRPLVLYDLVVRKKRRDKVVELLESVQLGSEYMGRYPHELSGGELQRVAIARAFSSDPDLIVCDEPVSSLDVSIQAGVLNLLVELQQKNKVSFVFISHDLNVVRHVSNRIAVMYNGRICEMGTPSELFVPPYHPYTEELLAAVPIVQVGVRQRKVIPTGNPSRYTTTTDTPCCQFSGRCPRYVGMICDKSVPPDKFTHSDRHLYCHIPLKELESMEPVLEKVVE